MNDTANTQKELRIERFKSVLTEAMITNQYTQRKLCDELGITIGTMTKYLRGAVDPNRVATEIQAALAKTLGKTTDALLHYYASGDYGSELTMQQVVSWCTSQMAQSDIPVLLAAISRGSDPLLKESNPVALPPAQESAGVTEADVELFSQMISGAMQLLNDKGINQRKAWRQIAFQLDEMECTDQEIDDIQSMFNGEIEYSVEWLQGKLTHFRAKGFDNCPCIKALESFDVLVDYKPLTSISSKATLVMA